MPPGCGRPPRRGREGIRPYRADGAGDLQVLVGLIAERAVDDSQNVVVKFPNGGGVPIGAALMESFLECGSAHSP